MMITIIQYSITSSFLRKVDRAPIGLLLILLVVATMVPAQIYGSGCVKCFCTGRTVAMAEPAAARSHLRATLGIVRGQSS